MTIDEKLDLLLSEVQSTKSDVREVKADVQGLQLDVQELQTEVQGLKTDVQDLKVKMQEVEIEIQEVTKSGQLTFEELMIVERETLKIQENVVDLKNKYDTLLLKSDNSTLLLKLIDKQAEETTDLKSRVQLLEVRMA